MVRSSAKALVPLGAEKGEGCFLCQRLACAVGVVLTAQPTAASVPREEPVGGEGAPGAWLAAALMEDPEPPLSTLHTPLISPPARAPLCFICGIFT